jgi:hypothetical protein
VHGSFDRLENREVPGIANISTGDIFAEIIMIDRHGNEIKAGIPMSCPSGYRAVAIDNAGTFEFIPNKHRLKAWGRFSHTQESLIASRWEKK